MSLPIRRARIENTGAHDAKGADYVAPHTGSENWKRNKSCKTKLDGSLPMRGARIEKAFWWIRTGRIRSLSMRGARIEIVDAFASLNSSSSLPTQGTRIEVFKSKRITLSSWYRSPCGERELKFRRFLQQRWACPGHSQHRERELKCICSGEQVKKVDHSPRKEEWELKYKLIIVELMRLKSLSKRGTWIEIR